MDSLKLLQKCLDHNSLQLEPKESRITGTEIVLDKDHTSHYAQAPREQRHPKRHVCQNFPDDVFQVHNRNKHHPCKIPLEDQSPHCIYIVVAMRDNLSDQITHAKVCSSYHYEQQTLKEKVMTQSC